MKLKTLAVLIPLLYATSAAAIEPFTIKDIRVEGIQRTEAGTVFSYLPVKVGDRMDDDKADAAIHALYATGFFKDVRLEVEQGVLVVLVRERPAVASIEINGVKSFSKDQLRDNLKYVGLVQGRIFDRSALDKAEQQLKREYVARGMYGVTVKTTVTPLERNRVDIAFDVNEGENSKIRQINIIGAHVFKESDLLDMMKLTTPDWLSWITKNDQYSKQKLAGDLETLRSYYLDAGYLEFSIDSTQVSITPDKKDVYIAINITEGPKYKVSSVKFAGPEKILSHEEMRKLVSVKAGDTFSRKELTESTKRIGDRLGDEGYAFANVNAIPEMDRKKHEVAFTFTVDPGQRVYVRRINVEGNTKTSDEVIRREFRQMEGAWFDTAKIKKSKQRVDKLDFFSEVNIETPAVAGTSDQVDVNVDVKEKPTGSFSVGAGVNSGEGLVLSTAITQANLFGSGNYLSAQMNTSKINTLYALSYSNPYYTADGVSRGFNLYKRNVDTLNSTLTSLAPYTSSTYGAGVNFGVPTGEDNTIHYGVTYENTTIGLTTSSPQTYVDYVNAFGATTSNYMGTIGWTHDGRDSAIYTTSGSIQRAFAEIGLPVSNALHYYKLTYQHQSFFPFGTDYTLMLNGEVGVGGGYGGKPLPFFKNYYAGGEGSVRGYQPNSLGPVDSTDLSTGGNKRIVGNAEFMFPMPGLSKEKSVRMSAFIDAGEIFGTVTQNVYPNVMGPRYSTGLAVAWLSPAGPLKLSMGFPIHRQPGDKLQKFQFTLGSLF
jgi:outer membrane protein insertion porin family